MLMSLPVPGVSCTDLKVCLGKLIQASSMPGPVLGRAGFCGPTTGTYAGSRLAVLVTAPPAAGGAAPGPPVVGGAGLVHAASTPRTANPPADRKNVLRLCFTAYSPSSEGCADTYAYTYARVAVASSGCAPARTRCLLMSASFPAEASPDLAFDRAERQSLSHELLRVPVDDQNRDNHEDARGHHLPEREDVVEHHLIETNRQRVEPIAANEHVGVEELVPRIGDREQCDGHQCRLGQWQNQFREDLEAAGAVDYGRSLQHRGNRPVVAHQQPGRERELEDWVDDHQRVWRVAES